MVSNKWILDNNKWYRLGPDGVMLTGWFKDSDGLWYYLDIDKGYMYSNCRILIDGKYYSFDSHGHWIENEEGAVSEQAICGTAGLLSSTLYKNVVAGIRDSNTITSNFQAWSNGGGKRIEGLYRRRTKEASMFLYGDYTGNN
ncbi:MAG: hypothetical protein E6240_21655 [Clostridium butyricum]|nr:hypothetical protein [Clostridium butyricum]